MNAIYDLLKPVDFIVVAVYFIILVAIGYYVSFVKKKNNQEYLVFHNRCIEV